MLLTEDRLPSQQERLPIRRCACVMNGWITHPEARFARNFINLPTDRCRGEHAVITENPALPGFRARSPRYMQAFPLLAAPPSQSHAICYR